MNTKTKAGAKQGRSRVRRKQTRDKVHAEARDRSSWLTVQLEDGEVSEADDTNDEEEVYAPRSQNLAIRREWQTR